MIPVPMLPAPTTPTVLISSTFIAHPPLKWYSSRIRLSAQEVRFPFFGEGDEPFLRVVGPEVFETVFPFDRQRLLHGKVDPFVYRRLDVPHRLPGSRRQQRSEFRHLFREHLRLDQAVDEADRQR